VFENYNEEFADFVFSCRTHPDEKIHEYDMIFGVQSDGNIRGLFQDYRDGILDEISVKRSIIAKQMSFKQLSIHNQELCDKMVLERVCFSEDGKELAWK